MPNLKITTTFNGGVGALRYEIYRNGHQETTVVVTDNGDKNVLLDTGMHFISVTGVNAPNGVTIQFDQPSTPATPDTITDNPVMKAYAIVIN
jgi:hypothetical protein